MTVKISRIYQKRTPRRTSSESSVLPKKNDPTGSTSVSYRHIIIKRYDTYTGNFSLRLLHTVNTE